VLCCYSNGTSAPIANPPNTAQLEGTTYHSPKLHPGPCSSVRMQRGTDRHTYTDTQTVVTNIHFTSAMPHKVTQSHWVILKVTLAVSNLFNVQTWGNIVHINCDVHTKSYMVCYFNCCIKTEGLLKVIQAVKVLTLSDPQSHSHTASLFNCNFTHSCATVDKISTDLACCVIPLR